MSAIKIKKTGVSLLADAKLVKTAPPKKVVASSFEVREGTLAVCRMVTGDVVAATLFHAILEIWVETKKKVVRIVNGEKRQYLFLSGDQLQTLSGLTKKQLEDNARRKLADCPFIEIGRGRLTPDMPNMYKIRIDHDAFWFEVAHLLDPTKKIKTTDQGIEGAKKVVDRNRLPHLFKRLFDLVHEEG